MVLGFTGAALRIRRAGQCSPRRDQQAEAAALGGDRGVHSDSARPGGTFRVRITMRPEVLRVEVEDDGGPWRADGGLTDLNGRGLVIVGAMARAWGVSTVWRVDAGQAGCTVWFEMPLAC
jgi:hypothetical protein